MSMPLSAYVGTLNVTTGAITDLGMTISSYQDDCDMLFFHGDVLMGADVGTGANRLDLLSLSQSTGEVTAAVVNNSYGSAGATPLRVAYDASRDKAYSWRASDGNLLEIDLASGAVTAIGETHASGTYGGQPVRAFFSAPPPATPCPILVDPD
jgi:hypothetical protein